MLHNDSGETSANIRARSVRKVEQRRHSHPVDSFVAGLGVRPHPAHPPVGVVPPTPREGEGENTDRLFGGHQRIQLRSRSDQEGEELLTTAGGRGNDGGIVR